MELTETKATFQKYHSYKDSGVEWLREIPEHWDIRRFKYLFKEINERSNNGLEDLLSVSQYTGVTKKLDAVEEGELLTTASTLEGYKRVYTNNLVSNIMLAWNGSLGFSPYDGITSPAYSVYRLISGNCERYFHYLVRSQLYLSEFKKYSSGIIESRLRLYTDDFFSIWSLLPPALEQTAIANFLDNKTAKIDRAIAQKEKMIVLLKERKQIIIQNVVTKGLNPSAKMKYSGVEWIGEIPEEWVVKKLKYVLKIKNGQDYKHIISETGYPVFGSGGQFAFAKEYLYDGEALLLGRKGTIDKPHYFKGKFWVVDTMFYSIAKKGFLTKFLYYVATTFPFKLYSTSTALPSMTQDDLNNNPISIPSLKEQSLIIQYIEAQSAKIDRAISLQEHQIEKLKEFKSTLIDNAVTGKIKVN